MAGVLEFPFRSHYIELDGRRIHFVDEGRGRPIIFLHGNPSWSFAYRKLIPPIATSGYRCIAPDLLGFGLSDKPLSESAYGFGLQVELLTWLIEKLELKNLVVVGHEWGVPISLKYAVEHQKNVSGIVILNSFLRPQGLPYWFRLLFQTGKVSSFLVRRLDLFRAMAFRYGFMRPPGHSIVRQYEMPHMTPSARAAIAAFLKLIPTSSRGECAQEFARIMEALSRWDIPLLVLWSDRDRLYRPREGIWIADRTLRGRFHLVRNAGHFLQEDAPMEVVNQTLSFLENYLGERSAAESRLVRRVMAKNSLKQRGVRRFAASER